MTIHELAAESIVEIDETDFALAGITQTGKLQGHLRDMCLRRVVEGRVGKDQLVNDARETTHIGGSEFRPKVSYVESDELVHSVSHEWAFTKRWGSSTEQVMNELVAAFSDKAVAFRKSDER